MKIYNFILGVFLASLIYTVFLTGVRFLLGDDFLDIFQKSMRPIYLIFGLFFLLPGIIIYFLYQRRYSFFALGLLVGILLTSFLQFMYALGIISFVSF